jgi:tetratricopeptide (TPR) repeat protein/outer membrane biosynthesis protein TonB
MTRHAVHTALLAWAACLAACTPDADLTHTVATVEPIRGAVARDTGDAPPLARTSAGARLRTTEGGLARLRLDLGPALLLDGATDATVADADTIRLDAGRLFAEVEPGPRLRIETAEAALRVADASLSVRRVDGRTEAHVVRGEVSFSRVGDAGEQGLVRAGETLTVPATGAVNVAPTALYRDWTGGLARPGPAEVDVEGIGTLAARVPDAVGEARWPLVSRRMNVRVVVEGDLAVTEVDQLFFNPASETVEGTYRLRVPEGAVLSRFAVDRGGRLVDGYIRERARARQAYEQRVYRGSTEDPALLEWRGAGHYEARIYPIEAGATRRIVIQYAQWLRPAGPGAPRLYRFRMGGGGDVPQIQEFFLDADLSASGATTITAGLGATVEGQTVRIRRSDFRPRSDFWLELTGEEAMAPRVWVAPHTAPRRDPQAPALPQEADESDYFYLPLVLPAPDGQEAPSGLDVVVVADVSAATERAQLELGRTVVEALLSHLGPGDRVAVVSSDVALRPVIEATPALVEATPANREALLDGLARVGGGGATDLGGAFEAAAALLDPGRSGFLLYVGDGAPTVGELGADALLRRMERLPDPVRFYALAIGADADLGLLDVLTRGGGRALRVEERAEAAEAALAILAHASRPVVHGVEFDLGAGVDNFYPRRARDAVLGEVFPIVGRVLEGPPTTVRVTGTLNGAPYERTFDLDPRTTDASTDLRLRWANERLQQALLEGASRETVVELGTRYGVITPFTSFYVPSHTEVSRLGPAGRHLLDQPLLQLADARPSLAARVGRGLATVALGPLTLAGCEAFDAAPGAGEMLAEQASAEDEEATQAAPSGAVNRYGVEGDGDDTARRAAQEAMARTQAQAIREEEAEAEPAAEAPRRSRARPVDADDRPAPPGDAERRAASDPLSGFDQLAGPAGERLAGTGRGGGGASEGTIGLGGLGTIGHGGGGGTGSGYGRGGGLRGRRAGVPRVRLQTPRVQGGLSADVVRRILRRHVNEVRFCYEQRLSERSDLGGRVTVGALVGPDGAVRSSQLRDSTLGDGSVEQCIVQAFRRWSFPAPEGVGIVRIEAPFVLSHEGAAPAPGDGGPGREVDVDVAGTGDIRVRIRLPPQDSAAHRTRRCSDASYASLAERRQLWRERVRGRSPDAMVQAYNRAAWACETPSWRDRRAFLDLMLASTRDVAGSVELYWAVPTAAHRRYLRGRILRRVNDAEDLALVRAGLRLDERSDEALVERLLAQARTPEDRLRTLRELIAQRPDSFDLKLRLLRELERLERPAEARRWAGTLRADPLADATVRSAVGEMYLRMGREDDARRVFSEIVEFAPLSELARRRLGDLYRAHGWFDDAYRQYQTLAEINPTDPAVTLLSAQAAAGAGRVDEALGLLTSVMQIGEPGADRGLPRAALLWSSVRFATLRAASGDDPERLAALERRRARTRILEQASPLRVLLTWSHPDAALSLYAAQPNLPLARPTDLYAEFGIEAFDLPEQEPGETYRFEVRRGGDALGAQDCQLLFLWNEGEEDERLEVVELRFEGDDRVAAFTLTDREVAREAR